MDAAAAEVSASRYELAGWWRRLVGYWLDGIFVGVVGAVLAAAHLVPLAFLASVAYWVYFIGHDGSTLGMRMLGMKVVPSDGRLAVTYADALVRWLMMLVSSILDLGFLWAAWDPRRQTWHDHVAKTLVVMRA